MMVDWQRSAKRGKRVAVMAVLLIANPSFGQLCRGDSNGDGEVTVDEVVASVDSALNGCRTPTARFEDNGDGTITDSSTGLMWEKKSYDGSINSVTARGTWSNGRGDPNGSIFTEFLGPLNTKRFAGYSDWRLPTREELVTIADYSTLGPPATYNAFDENCAPGCSLMECSCTAYTTPYWTMSAFGPNQLSVWVVDFAIGDIGVQTKGISNYARAVRDSSR